jgi:hypothetical protein
MNPGATAFTVILNPASSSPSDDVRSPETYVGFARTENFASPDQMAQNAKRTYSASPLLALNQWGFVGSWTVGRESGKLESTSGKIVFRFHSRDVHMVLGPTKNGTVRFRVKLNGVESGTVTVSIQRPMARARSASRECTSSYDSVVRSQMRHSKLSFSAPELRLFRLPSVSALMR